MTAAKAALSVLLAALVVSASGCASSTTDPSGESSALSADQADDSVDVPDVTGQDGADAVSTIQTADLTATLADGTDEDPSFDPGRDPAGCEVTNQDPAGGDTAASGDEITLSLDCRQTDWDNQEGPQWDAFNEAYDSGFDDGCESLFDESPDGTLHNAGTEYTDVDCTNLNPGDASDSNDLPSDVPDDPESDGDALGQGEGCAALFESEGIDTLNYGTLHLTEEDCPNSTAAAPSSAGTTARPRRHRPTKAAPKTSDLYRVPQSTWETYDRATKLKAAAYFIANNPHDCGGLGLTPEMLVTFVDAGGIGDVHGVPINQVMLGRCTSGGE